MQCSGAEQKEKKRKDDDDGDEFYHLLLSVCVRSLRQLCEVAMERLQSKRSVL